jgi:hypothetical protein
MQANGQIQTTSKGAVETSLDVSQPCGAARSVTEIALHSVHCITSHETEVFITTFMRTSHHNVRFEVFTAVTMKKGVLWNVTTCGSCKN